MIDNLRAREQRDWARLDLARYREAEKNKSYYEDKLSRAQVRAESLSGQTDSEKVQVVNSRNSTEESTIKYIELCKKFNPKIEQAEHIIDEISQKVDGISNETHQRILRDVWFYEASLKEVAVMEGYEYQTIRIKHGEALEEYGEKYQRQSTTVNTNQQI